MCPQVGAAQDSDLTGAHLRALTATYKDIYRLNNKVFPEDPYDQLYEAVFAVFDSWESPRAIKYREAEGITGLLGTAVNVQAMCFGNMGETSGTSTPYPPHTCSNHCVRISSSPVVSHAGTGVCFTRNPNTGERLLYGEYLINAQGEDVVAGIRTPQPIATLAQALPEAYAELLANVETLEANFKDMQDIEFTVQEGKLFMLQTRGGKRGGQAAVKIAVDMVDEGLVDTAQAIMMVKPEHLNQLLHPQFKDPVESPVYKGHVLTKGLPASPGAAVGKIVFSPEKAEAEFAAGHDCILVRDETGNEPSSTPLPPSQHSPPRLSLPQVRDETSPEDVGGMWAAKGVLTARGGMTSHAAVVARGWGKTCICGCAGIHVDEAAGVMTVTRADGSQKTYHEGDVISLNGDTGEVLDGALPLKPPSLQQGEIRRFMQWVDDKRSKMKVLTNADTPADALEARKNGAQGIGLARTEHMFFSPDRINVVRRMILAPDQASQAAALAELLPFQRADFQGMLQAMDGLPVTVRLLDPPLHEFLPPAELIDDAFAATVAPNLTAAEVVAIVEKMKEVNPMLGLRGCRLGITIPELVEMQVRALFEASVALLSQGLDPRPEIMVPLVGSVTEFTHQKDIIEKVAQQVFNEHGKRVQYKIGTMIEVPRAALPSVASDLAKNGAEFFSYGTNDLTQMTYGFSRDDVGTFLPTYLKAGVLDKDPFQTIDEEGVGALITMSANEGKKCPVHAISKAGVCGEHGGDPTSIRFFIRSGLDYISCSPARLPVARLTAAQCFVEDERKARTAALTEAVESAARVAAAAAEKSRSRD